MVAQPEDIKETNASEKEGKDIGCYAREDQLGLVFDFLNRFLYKARTQATCANFDFFGRTFDQGSDGSKIWAKYAFCAIIRMTDIISH